MEHVERRTSRTAAALLFTVLALLAAPIGVVITQVVAQSMGGTNPPQLVVAMDPVSDAVAATPAEFRVDESGAATYSVPIFVVPGTAGVAPQLSLNYSSQGGYGPMGRGWSIGGLSAISRCRATREAGDFLGAATPDGNPRPINFSSTDRYCLDGQRLVASPVASCPAVGGMTVQELRTEIETFQRVCAYQASAETGPAFFTVERKDGSTSWYGDRDHNASANRPDGYVESTGPGHTTKALSWAQTRFQDSTGNTIDFHYIENPAGAGTGEHLIGEVRYTGKVALPGQLAPASEPFARVVFSYVARPTSQWGNGYAAGGLFTQSRQLDSITSCGTPDCAVAQQVRHYALQYQTSASGSGQDTLTSLRECRDNRAEVCALSTLFEWSSGKYEFATLEKPSAFPVAISEQDRFKMGDIDGDGRPDLVFIRGGGHGCSAGSAVVGFSRLDASGRPIFANWSTVCLPANIQPRGEGAWHLIDYDGDGRDDLFVSRGLNQGWQIHPSTGIGFNTSADLLSGLSPAIPSMDDSALQPHLLDLNGDGLMDVMYMRAGVPRARLMERQGGEFSWSSERTVQLDQASLGPTLCQQFPGHTECSRTVSQMPATKTGFVHLADFNGDASADLMLQITEYAMYLPPGCRRGDPCHQQVHARRLHALSVESISSTTVTLTNYSSFVDTSNSNVVLVDINGDGLTDVFYRITDFPGDGQWRYRINTGSGFAADNLVSLPNYQDYTRFADVNGDGRTDMLYLVDLGSIGKVYYARLALPGGGFAPGAPLPGGSNTRLCEGSGCNPATSAALFTDLDGDGNLDFMSLRLQNNPAAIVSRSNSRFTPRDTIVGFQNGLGATTVVNYAPLTNSDLYRRASNSRNTTNWGRGAAVQDLLTPMYVVARASSSSPQAGNPNAMASVHYRYANARAQAGGRGFLGFASIETIDPNQSGGHVVTSTTYAQNFPFIGMPVQTVKRLVGGSYTVPACLSGAVTDACFATPGTAHPDLGGQWFAHSQHVWQVSPSSLAAQAPLHVRTDGTEEAVRDPYTGAQTSKVATAFAYGNHGNVTQTIVDTYTGTAATPTATVITQNSYTDDAAKWRLGRLTSSTITHRRPGRPDVVRTTGFSYAMTGPATGLLTEERLQPGGAANLASAKSYLLDDYGNRLQTTTCAGPATPCNTSGFQFRPAAPTHVKRYARVEYDERGRFPVSTWEPFWNGSGGAEQRTSYVVARNAFGDAVQVRDANAVLSMAIKGWLGRDYFTWQQTSSSINPINSGIRSLTTYRTCSQVECPAGAAFRQQVETTAAPRQWTYFDVLGRPVMQASETFNVGVANEDVAATCTDYDVVGRPWRVSNPFFLSGTVGAGGPTGIGGVCASVARQWTTTTYDALGRAVRVLGPDSSQASVAYAGLTTTKTDPRGNPTTETRNGLGEVVAITDAAGLTVNYAFDAAGNTLAVTRNAGGGAIANTFVYDVLGRKVQQSDPDTGLTSFEYNALGELTAQVDALGNRTEHALDARGRVWRTAVKDFNGLTESESTFTFDIAQYGLGQLAQETITGTYAGWSGQPGTALDYLRSHNFDALGRPIGSTLQVDGHLFFGQVVYDVLGRPWQSQDASGQAVKTEYGLRGHSQALCGTTFGMDPSTACAGADTLQRTLRTDAWGNVAHERRGNSAALDVVRNVWAMTGRVSSICAGNSGCSLVNEQYGWDAAGNLSSHLKEQRYLETFTYDSLNRLSTGTLLMRDGVTVNQPTLAMGYDALGNICSRNGTGYGYGYGAAAGCTASGMASAPMATAATIERTPLAQQALDRSDHALDRHPRAGGDPWTLGSAATPIRAPARLQLPTAWRGRFAHHAPERSRSHNRDRDRDRASFMDDDEDGGLAHGFVGGSGTFLRRGSTGGDTASGSSIGTASTTGTASPAMSAFATLMTTGPGGPHAVSQTVSGGQATTYTYDHRGNQVHRDAPGTANDRTITYSLDDKAHQIQMGNGQRVRFWYGPDGQRYKREEAGKVTYYLGGVEAIVQGGVTTFKRYVGGIALQTVTGGVIQSTRYLFHDQLGSLVRIANADGSIAERLDYMAFGGRRNPSDPHQPGGASPNTPRGYTGHEYVDGTGVIHMNGRIYDSELGRFLQADPVIQAPLNTQSWNAYTYVFNNPFAYTDPTGMISWRQVLGIAIAVVGTWVTMGMDGGFFAKLGVAMAFGAASGYVATGTFRGAVTGAFTAGITFGIGWQIQGWGAFDKIAAQAVTGGVMESLQGGKFGNGFLSAGMTAAAMPNLRGIRNDVVRTATGALIGGSISKATGGKFSNGAISGAIQGAMMGQTKDLSSRSQNASSGAGTFSDAPTDELQELLSNAETREQGIRETATREGYGRFANQMHYVDGIFVGPDGPEPYTDAVTTPGRITFYAPAFRHGYHGLVSSMDHEVFHLLQYAKYGRTKDTKHQITREFNAYKYQWSRPAWRQAPAGYRWGALEAHRQLLDKYRTLYNLSSPYSCGDIAVCIN